MHSPVPSRTEPDIRKKEKDEEAFCGQGISLTGMMRRSTKSFALKTKEMVWVSVISLYSIK